MKKLIFAFLLFIAFTATYGQTTTTNSSSVKKKEIASVVISYFKRKCLVYYSDGTSEDLNNTLQVDFFTGNYNDPAYSNSLIKVIQYIESKGYTLITSNRNEHVECYIFEK